MFKDLGFSFFFEKVILNNLGFYLILFGFLIFMWWIDIDLKRYMPKRKKFYRRW